MAMISVCACGHSAHWHGDHGHGGCEHDAACRCEGFRDSVVGPPRFITTESGYVVQELGEDGNYRTILRAANGGGDRIAVLLNRAAGF